MKLILEINNKTDCEIEKDLMEKIFRNTVEAVREEYFFSEKNISVSVALVDSNEIQLLNEKYRSKNEVTDILSFSDFENLNPEDREKKDIFLGELVLCCEYIKKSANINNVSFDKEISYIFSHGILHLLGVSHGDEMFSIQDQVLKKVFSEK
jgi:probable rRNA maturation factor